MNGHVFGKKDKVVLLSKRDFDEKTGDIINKKLNKGITTVMVYADWCGHCQVAKPIYADISVMTCCQTRAAAIDSEKNEDLLECFKNCESAERGLVIQGYPTFLQFKDGVFYRTYDAPSSNGDRLMKFVLGTKNY